VKAQIVLLAGDGIGPEIVQEARLVLEAIATSHGHAFNFTEKLIGGAAIDATGGALPENTLSACQSADAVLLGAVGGPQWDNPLSPVRPEQGLLGLRQGLRLYANLRPVQIYPSLMDASPLKPEKLQGVDLLVVRELTGGLYFGRPQLRETIDGVTRAVDTLEYTDSEIRRVLRLAFRLAQGRRKLVTSVDKANVLESSRLWRQVATEVGAEFPDVKLEHQLVDSAAMRLISQPQSFDVLVTENMFGDILSDEASVLSGSLGLLPSTSIGDDGHRGLYEPIHGSAPDIAGRGVANPLGTILSAAMLLRHSLKLEAEACLVEQAVAQVIAEGKVTADLGGSASTREVGERVIHHLQHDSSREKTDATAAG
jgi:3-isopropylmalate dehydrogenase